MVISLLYKATRALLSVPAVLFAGGTAKDVCSRTPAFSAWQQGRWLAHCADAAVPRPGGHRGVARPPEALEVIRSEYADPR